MPFGQTGSTILDFLYFEHPPCRRSLAQVTCIERSDSLYAVEATTRVPFLGNFFRVLMRFRSYRPPRLGNWSMFEHYPPTHFTYRWN